MARFPDSKKCRGSKTIRDKDGKAIGKRPCKQWAVHGATVCRFHGGASPQVKRKAQERLAELDPLRTMKELQRIAFADFRGAFKDDGTMRPLSEWPDELAPVIAGFEILKKNLTAGDKKTDEVLKAKFWDKVKAIEMLMKHQGLLKDKVETTGELVITWGGEKED